MEPSLVCFCGLMPHPPIIIPAVGGQRLHECRATHTACVALAARALASHPDRVVLISPHAPRHRSGCGLWVAPRLRGDLSQFRSGAGRVDLPGDTTFGAAFEVQARGDELRPWRIPDRALDHGSVVPLWFLCEAGWRGPTAVLSLPDHETPQLQAWGRTLGSTLRQLPGRTALIASGDMSHRVLPDAPAGFHPRAIEFDREVVARVREGRLQDVSAIDTHLRALAAEDIVDSITLAAATLQAGSLSTEVLSYEHPFGVGYLVAVVSQDPPAGRPIAIDELPAVAREALAAALEGRAPVLPRPEGEWAQRAAVFVTWRQRSDRALRGCIGSLEPGFADLVAETAARACDAALRDGRFPPVSREELPSLSCEVSLLEPAQDCDGIDGLDPVRWGLIVSSSTGRRGVLLPGIDGITTGAQQLEIAMQKAGIAPGTPVTLRRFGVRRFTEQPP